MMESIQIAQDKCSDIQFDARAQEMGENFEHETFIFYVFHFFRVSPVIDLSKDENCAKYEQKKS